MSRLLKFINLCGVTSSLLLSACGAQQQIAAQYQPIDGIAGGCGRDMFYRLSSDKSTAVSFSLRRSLFAYDEVTQVFHAGDPDMQAELLLFNGSAEGYFCNDVLSDLPSSHWQLVSGKVTSRKINADCFGQNVLDTACHASATLEHAVFQKENSSETIEIDQLDITDVLIGWRPG